MRHGPSATLVEMKFAPEIRPQIHRMIEELDDGVTGIATIWRDIGHRARRRKLLQPSYESIRRLVHNHRKSNQLEYARVNPGVTSRIGRLRDAADPSTVMLLILVGD